MGKVGGTFGLFAVGFPRASHETGVVVYLRGVEQAVRKAVIVGYAVRLVAVPAHDVVIVIACDDAVAEGHLFKRVVQA